MKHKEFQTGILEATAGAPDSQVRETCAEYKTFAVDILNHTGTALTLISLLGYDSLGQLLYSPVYGGIAGASDFSGNITATSLNNLAVRLKRLEGAGGGNIPAGFSAVFYSSIADSQIVSMQFRQTSGSGTFEVMGLFKGSIEGISNLFEVTTAIGVSAWVDCRAYGYTGFEVVNSGSVALTSCSAEVRRHPLGTSDGLGLNFAPFAETNPMRRLQRIRNLNPATLTVGNRSQIDLDITEAHSIRFVIAPTNAQATIRGVLKG